MARADAPLRFRWEDGGGAQRPARTPGSGLWALDSRVGVQSTPASAFPTGVSLSSGADRTKRRGVAEPVPVPVVFGSHSWCLALKMESSFETWRAPAQVRGVGGGVRAAWAGG